MTPPIPHGRTARRLEWVHLPPHVRALVEERTGSPVVEAASQTSGFTPGFASVLTCADGSRHFVKAASTRAQRLFAQAYREEARKLAALPPVVPAPRLLWLHDADDWVVLGIEHVEHRTPARPWSAEDLDRVAAVLAATAEALTPAPADLPLDDVATGLGDWAACWDRVRAGPPALTGLAEHLDEAAGLATRFVEVAAGDTLVHTDVRDDNVLLAADGRVLLCDWNWPVRGAAWLDTVLLMVGPRGDGLDVEAVLSRSPLLRDVPADAVDAALAALAGYFLAMAAQPVPPTSPYLRAAQQWQGEVTWQWLCERRGWDAADRPGSDLGGRAARC